METSPRYAAPEADWWRQAVVYQIYPRSFADSDGDGVGDLRGILSRVPYLAALGIDAVWLSPFYPSALADGGYDVDDYRDVDPRLGTLADFDEMTAGLHSRGIKLIVDIVPNHTSSRHAWFREALAAPRGSPPRNRYIFRDGQGPDGAQPPSDWRSIFGGPAWTRVPDGQWYLHLFTEQQPDLNWQNREVRDDFLTTLRFWSDRGADGFRVDVAHGLAKNLAEPLDRLDVQADPVGSPDGSHPLWDRDEVHGIYAEWRQVFNEYDPPRAGVAEAWVHPSRRPRYASPDGLGQAFNFDLLDANWDPAEFERVITDNLADAQRHGASTTWVLSNHDVVRHASRYALQTEGPLSGTRNARAWLLSNGTSPTLDRGLGLRRARAATLLMLALPGSAYLYQGEELGLHEVADLPAELVQDPAFLRSGGAEKGRDGCRVPLPWTTGDPSFGFSADAAHLPQPAWFGPLSVEAQQHDPASTLALYREALSWRRQLTAAESLEWMPGTSGQVLHFGRPGGWQCVSNFGPRAVPLPHGTVVVASSPLQEGLLPADTTAWIIPLAPDHSPALTEGTQCCDWQGHGYGIAGSLTMAALITCTSSRLRTSATLRSGTGTPPLVMPPHRTWRTGPWSLTRSAPLTVRPLTTLRPGPVRWCAAGTARGSCSTPVSAPRTASSGSVSAWPRPPTCITGASIPARPSWKAIPAGMGGSRTLCRPMRRGATRGCSLTPTATAGTCY